MAYKLHSLSLSLITSSIGSVKPDVSISMFADDAKIFSTHPNHMQLSINNMSAWIELHKLNLAIHKCFILNITKPRTSENSQFLINDTQIETKPVALLKI